MANKKLTVIIDGKEYVSKEATKASKSLGGIEKASKAATKAMGATAAVVGVFVAVGAAIKNVTDAYGDQAKVNQKVNSALLATKNTLGVTRGELSEFATEMSRMTGIADETIAEAEALMITFTKIGSEVFPDAIKSAADMSVMFGQDISQSAIQLGTALNDPIAGVGRLKRIGISFTEDQKAMIEGFVNQNDIMSAQKIIIDELNAEFGGVAENMGKEWPAKVDRLHNAFVDGKQILGDYSADALSLLITKVTEFIEKTNDAKAAQKGFNDIWSDEGADSIGDYEQALIEAQNRIDTVQSKVDELQSKIDSGHNRFGKNSELLKEEEKNLRLAMADWESINRILQSNKEIIEANASRNKELADEAEHILKIEELVDATITDLGDKRQQEIDITQQQIDKLASYRNELEAVGDSTVEVQTALNLLVAKRDKLQKEQLDALKDENKETEDLLRSNRLIDKFLENATSAYDEQAQALSQIPEIEALIFQAAEDGNTAWLAQLAEVKEELYEIAGIELPNGEVETGGSEESDSINVGGEVGTIIQAFEDGGDIWISLINIVLSSLTQFEQFNKVLNIISTLIGSLGQTIILPLLQILSPVLALVQSIVQVVGVALFPYLKFLIGIMSILTPVLQLVTVVFSALMTPVVALGAIFGWLGDWLKYFGNVIQTAIYNIQLSPLNKEQHRESRHKVLGAAIESAVKTLWNAGSQPYEELDFSTPSYDDLTFGSGSSVYGGNTSVTQMPDIYIYQTFSNSPIVGV